LQAARDVLHVFGVVHQIHGIVPKVGKLIPPLTSPVPVTGHDDVVWYLHTTVEELDSVLILRVEGRVFTETAQNFAADLARCEAGVRRGLIVDFSSVDYINSEGLRVLTAAAERARASDRELVVCGLCPPVRTAFDLAGSIGNLAIEPSLDAAIHHVTRSG
jgi:anti-sigma B factor antagonist